MSTKYCSSSLLAIKFRAVIYIQCPSFHSYKNNHHLPNLPGFILKSNVEPHQKHFMLYKYNELFLGELLENTKIGHFDLF